MRIISLKHLLNKHPDGGHLASLLMRPCINLLVMGALILFLSVQRSEAADERTIEISAVFYFSKLPLSFQTSFH